MSAPRIVRSAAPILGTAIVGGAAIYIAQRQFRPNELRAESNEAPKIFTSGFSFQQLKLRSSEDVNHNTKRLRFDLPESNAVSGLQPICEPTSRLSR